MGPRDEHEDRQDGFRGRYTHRHRRCFTEGECSAVHSAVIRVVEIAEQVAILLAGVDLQKFTCWHETGSALLYKTEEVTESHALLKMQQYMIDLICVRQIPGEDG